MCHPFVFARKLDIISLLALRTVYVLEIIRNESAMNIPALVEALRAANERKDALVSELAKVNSYQHSQADYDELEKELNAHFESCGKTILTRQIRPARQILRKLFNGARLPWNEKKSKAQTKGVQQINGRDGL